MRKEMVNVGKLSLCFVGQLTLFLFFMGKIIDTTPAENSNILREVNKGKDECH